MTEVSPTAAGAGAAGREVVVPAGVEGRVVVERGPGGRPGGGEGGALKSTKSEMIRDI